MTKRLIFKQCGVINKVSIRAAIEPEKHPPKGAGIDGGYPRILDLDICTGSDHITYNKINNWSVTQGTFDPFSLFDATLKRLEAVTTEVTQAGVSFTLDTYSVKLAGKGSISFPGGSGYSWSTGNTTNAETIDSDEVTVTFTGTPPTGISIQMQNNVDEVQSISVTLESTDEEVLVNGDFTDIEVQFYDIESWYGDAYSGIIPRDTLGWLQGFNEDIIYTIFE